MSTKPSSSKRALPSTAGSGSKLSALKRQKLLSKPSNRPTAPTLDRSDSGSGSDDDDEEDASGEEDEEEAKATMMRALEAHGRAMFGEVAPLPSSVKGKGREIIEDQDEEDEGWDEDGSDEDGEDYDSQDEDDSEAEDGEGREDENDVELQPEGSGGPRLPEVVYAPKKYTSSESSKADYKAFMSSKASKILADPLSASSPGSSTKADLDTDKANLTLDKTLHTLLLTSLLAAPTHASTPLALQGRLNELAGSTPLGTGERLLHKRSVGALSGKNAVGRGMRKVGLQRWEKSEADARERGDSGLQGLTGTTSIYAKEGDGGKRAERRQKDGERGLAMGTGRFQQGVLKLSQSDMDGVKRESERRARRERESSRGRGGRGGRGGGGGRGGRGGGGGGGDRGGGRGRGGGGGGRGRGK